MAVIEQVTLFRVYTSNGDHYYLEGERKMFYAALNMARREGNATNSRGRKTGWFIVRCVSWFDDGTLKKRNRVILAQSKSCHPRYIRDEAD